jgi:diguanylate cyclase (GGDEF)-like protein
MKFVGASSSAIWRQRVYGGLGSFFFYLILHFTNILPFTTLVLTAQLGSFVLYLLAAFSSSSPWVRWTLAFTDTITLSLMIQATGGQNSPFLMIIPVWFFGVALANLVDGETQPIPWMLLMGAGCGIVGTWQNFDVLTGSIFFVALFSMGAAATTLSVERRAARRDPLLTMLYNRSAGLSRLEEMCKSGEAVSVAYVDLSDFKGFNDKLGHKIGDEVLHEVARRLIGSVRRNDLVARIGGDEFLIASQHPDLQNRLEQIFTAPMKTSRGELNVKGDVGSIGINRQDEIDAILERADAQMYTRKRAAKASQSLKVV